MTVQDIVKQCNCKYAKENDGWRKSCTFYVVCKLHNSPTDISHCEKCKERQSINKN